MNTMIGNNIKKLRQLNEISQLDISSRLGISQTAYSMIERGKRAANDDLLQEIAEIFKIDVNIIKNKDLQSFFRAYIRRDFPFSRN